MKKIITILSALMLVYTLSACKKIIGQGPVVTETRDLSAFTSIESDLPGDLILVQGTVSEVKVQAQENIISDVKTKVENGTLKLYVKNGLRISTGTSLKVYVTMPVIDKLSLIGSGNIEAEQGIASNNLSLDLTGSGNIKLNAVNSLDTKCELTGSGDISINGGQTERFKLKLTGSGDYKGQYFNSLDAIVNLTGSGNATVNVSNTLDASISGSGNIYYYGNPTLSKSETGSGRVKKKG